MSGLFHSLLSKKHAKPECLTAQGIAARLERMFSEAASYIIIVSPYIKLNLRLRDILGEKKKAGVDITIIHKGPFTATEHTASRIPFFNGTRKIFSFSRKSHTACEPSIGIVMKKPDK